MKRLILVKQSPAIQLGHMYEHIYCMRIDELFHSHNLFPHLDFALYGKMYHGGILVIDIELYTANAVRLADKIKTLQIDLNQEIISRTLSMMLAEMEQPIETAGYDAVVKELEELHEQRWQTIDSLAIIDAKKIRRSAGPIYIVHGRAIPVSKIVTGVFLEREFAASNRELMPLFGQIARLIVSTWQGTVANSFGLYSYDDKFKSSKEQEGLTNTFHAPRVRGVEIDVDEVLEKCMTDIRELLKTRAIERLAEELNKMSYEEHSDSAPNYERNYEDTLVFMGTKGWQQIVTEENCAALLRHLSINVSFGRKKVVQPVHQIL